MSHHSKNKSFHFSWAVVIRCLIFALIIYFSVNYLSKNKNNSLDLNLDTQNLKVLGISTDPAIINLQKNVDIYWQQAQDYLNQQVINLKKELVTQMYQEILKNIENTNKK